MAGHLRGNLGLKSGASVDTRPPRSLLTSQKMRDRRLRDLIINSLHPQLTSPLPLRSINEHVDHLCVKSGHVARRRIQSALRSEVLDKPMRNNTTFGSAKPVGSYMNTDIPSQMMEPTYNRSQLETNHLYHVVSVPTFSFGHPHLSSVVIATHDTHKQTYSRDVLDIRPHYFTEPDKPFVPRTLKNSHESRLKNSKCYNHVQPKSATNRRNESNHRMAKDQWPQSSSQSKHQKPGRCFSVEGSPETSHLVESKLMDITVRSRDGQYTQQTHHNVPPLAISKDKDHMNWLHEKSRRAQIQESENAHQKSVLQVKQQLVPSSVDSSLREAIKMELLRRDEENKYLMFAKEVTDDIISRGICSDSVLLRVCENHMERRKHKLDMSCMRAVVDDLLGSIGLRETSPHRDPVASLLDSHYQLRSMMSLQRPKTGSYSSSNHMHGDRGKLKSGREDSPISQKYGDMSEGQGYSEMRTINSHLSSNTHMTSTLKFGETGDSYGTMNLEVIHDKVSMNNASDMTLTQALQQYQHDLTAKEATDDITNSVPDSESAYSESAESNGHSNTSEVLTE